ncbi:MAG TPA: CDP-alcohol phosphatidyltransferase family protein [Rubrobacteraceae bacterium]|nr:CDP-alcohol phosphatidyltransferase family protein [Rubrobacteraceae bacterium]
MDEPRTEDQNLIEDNSTPSWFRLKAALVHLYTASGAVLALLILVAAFQGEAVRALWLMLAALAIDSTDGLLARKMRVSEALPFFDGAMLDNIVDYMTYVFAPMALLWSEGYLPEGNAGLIFAALPLLASSYQFCRVDAKTDDHYFLGFPSYFNVVAFYIIVFDVSAVGAAWLLAICSILVFIPIRYVYPTRTVAFRRLSLFLTTLWLISYAVILFQMPEPKPLILGFSLLYLLYYFGLSLYLSGKLLEARRLEQEAME